MHTMHNCALRGCCADGVYGIFVYLLTSTSAFGFATMQLTPPLLLLTQMFIFHNVTITVPENFTQCTTHGSFVQHWQETLYNMFTFVCLFLLPLVIMIFCYTRILVEISSRMARNNCESFCQNQCFKVHF